MLDRMIPFCYTVLANVHFSDSLLLFLNKTSRRFSLCQCTEKKFKNLIVAGTVGAVLLLVILLSVMIFQIISISVEKKKLNELEEQIAIYKELIEDGENTVEARTSRWWIIERARELGYVFDGDKLLGE